jgi:hypothetical protein
MLPFVPRYASINFLIWPLSKASAGVEGFDSSRENIEEKTNDHQERDGYRISASLPIGMLNWVEVWCSPPGKLSPSKLY